MQPKLNISNARHLQPGGVLKCDVVRGLQLRANGTCKSWLVYYRAPTGEQRRPKVGEFPTLGIDAARDVARELLRRVAAGADPGAERQAARAAPTVDDLYADWLNRHARPKLAKSTVLYNEGLYETHVRGVIGRRKVASVRVDDIEAVLARAAVRRPYPKAGAGKGPRTVGGKTVANRVRALLWGLFSLAEASRVGMRVKGSNPVPETSKNIERPRRRHIRRDEFARVADALRHFADVYPRHVAAILATMYSGTRVSELLKSSADMLEGDRLTLAEHKTMRTGAERVIYLPRQALQLIRSVPKDSSGRLFGRLDRYAVRDVWEKVRAKAGVTDLQLRDLRRTFASVAKTRGASLDQIGDVLGHGGNPDVTAGYAYLFEEGKRELVQSTADELDVLMLGTDASR